MKLLNWEKDINKNNLEYSNMIKSKQNNERMNFINCLKLKLSWNKIFLCLLLCFILSVMNNFEYKVNGKTLVNKVKKSNKTQTNRAFGRIGPMMRIPSAFRNLPPLFNPSIYFPRNKFITANTLPSQYPENEDINSKRNCNDLCLLYHSRVLCNLGIVAGESIEPVNYSFLTCTCISDEHTRGGNTISNIHTHSEWCFNPFGCYRAIGNKCKEIKKPPKVN